MATPDQAHSGHDQKANAYQFLGGVVFGWLYWRRSLETAMVAHATVHVGFFIINVGLLVLGLAGS